VARLYSDMDNPITEFLAGGEIEMNDGPLTGLRGILIDVTPGRVIMSVALLNRSVAVQIDPAWISLIRRRDAVISGQIQAAVELITAESSTTSRHTLTKCTNSIRSNLNSLWLYFWKMQAIR